MGNNSENAPPRLYARARNSATNPICVPRALNDCRLKSDRCPPAGPRAETLCGDAREMKWHEEDTTSKVELGIPVPLVLRRSARTDYRVTATSTQHEQSFAQGKPDCVCLP